MVVLREIGLSARLFDTQFFSLVEVLAGAEVPISSVVFLLGFLALLCRKALSSRVCETCPSQALSNWQCWPFRRLGDAEA